MATIITNVRWSDNTEALRRNLAEGIDTVDAMRKAVDRTVRSLGGEGLYTAANKAAAAVSELKDTTKLTSAEQDRINGLMGKAIEKAEAMGRTVPTVWREIAAATKQADDASQHAHHAVDQLASDYAKIFSGAATKGMHGLGTGILDDAKAITTAVTQIGGASKLTAAEQEKVNQSVTEAIAKYKAMGQTAPAEMLALAEATKKTVTESERLTAVGQRLGDIGSAARTVGMGLTAAITAPLVGLGAIALKSAIDFETAFAGVRKTVPGTAAELDTINAEFREMAKVTPATAVELAHIGETAGQMGVQKEKISAFTKTIVDISNATHLTADEAANDFARLAIVLKMPQDQFTNLGSAVVALGNFGASTEQEMLTMAQRIAAAGATANMTAPQVLGIANALASAGIEAEAGGTAVSRAINKIGFDVASGGGHLQTFAKVAGMSAEQFRKAWHDDAGVAFTQFMQGLADARKRGGDELLGLIDELGFKEVRMRNAFMAAANAGDLMRESIELGVKAFRENTEVARASEERYKTTANQLKILKNNLNDVAITLGNALLPMLTKGVDQIRPFVQQIAAAAKAFEQWPGPAKEAAVALAALAAGTPIAILAFGSLARSIGSLLELSAKFPAVGDALGKGIGAIASSGPTAVTAIGNITTALAGMPVVVAGVQAGLVGLAIGAAFVFFEHQIAETIAQLEKDWARLQKMGTPQGDRQLAAESLLDPAQRKIATEAIALQKKVDELPPITVGMKVEIKPPTVAPLGKLTADAAKQLLGAAGAAGPMITSLSNLHGLLATTAQHMQTLADKVLALTDAQRQDIASKVQQGYTIKAIATETGIATDVVSAYLKAQHLQTAAQKGQIEATRELNALQVDYVATANTIPPVIRAQVDQYLAADATVDTLAKRFPELTKTQLEAAHKAYEANKKFSEGWENLNSLGATTEDTIAGVSDEVRGLATYYAQAGASAKDLEQAFPGLTAAQAQAFVKAAAETKKYVEHWQKAQDDITAIWDDGLAIQEEINKRGLALQNAKLDRQASKEKDAWQKRFNEGTASDEQLQEALDAIDDKYNTLRAKAAADAEHKKQQTLQQIWAESAAIDADLYLSAVDAKLAANDRELAAHLDTIKAEYDGDVDLMNAEIALAQKKAQAIKLENSAVFQAWKSLNTDMRQEWASTWVQALNREISWKDAALKPFHSFADGVKRIFAGLIADVEAQLLNPLFNMMRGGLGSVLSHVTMPGGSGALPLGAAAGGLGGLIPGAGMPGMPGAQQAGGFNWASMFSAGAPTAAAAASFAPMGPGASIETVSLPASNLASTSTIGYQTLPGQAPSGDIASATGSGGTSAAAQYGGGALIAGMGALQFGQAWNSGSKMQLGLAGAQTGAGIGTMILPGIGTAIGAGVGALAGLLAAVFHKPEFKHVMADAGRDWGTALTAATGQAFHMSAELAKQIAATEKALPGISRAGAMVVNLSGIIQEQGGLNARNLDVFTAKLRDTFSLIQRGEIKAADGAKILDENWQAFVDTGTSGVGVLNKKLVELIGLNKQFGTDSKAIAQYLGQQATGGTKGFATAFAIPAAALANVDTLKSKLADLQAQLGKASGADQQAALRKEIEATTAALAKQQGIYDATGIHSQAMATASGAALAGMFDAALASGKSLDEALAMIEPAVSALDAQFQKSGYDGGAAFNMLRDQIALAKDEIAGPALQSVDGLTEGMVALGNTRKLTQDEFASFGQQVTQTLTSLVAQGKDGGQVMTAMQPSLQRLWEEEQTFGFKADAATQALLDEAEASGAVGEKHKSSTDQMIDALGTLHTDLQGIVTALTGGGGVAEAFAQVGARARTALDSIPSHKDIDVTTHYHHDGQSDETRDGGTSGDTSTAGLSTGGLVTTTGVLHFAQGGIVPAVTYLAGGGVAHVLHTAMQPHGTDTVPAMLTPGEMVVTQPQQHALAAALTTAPTATAFTTLTSGVRALGQQATAALQPVSVALETMTHAAQQAPTPLISTTDALQHQTAAVATTAPTLAQQVRAMLGSSAVAASLLAPIATGSGVAPAPVVSVAPRAGAADMGDVGVTGQPPTTPAGLEAALQAWLAKTKQPDSGTADAGGQIVTALEQVTGQIAETNATDVTDAIQRWLATASAPGSGAADTGSSFGLIGQLPEDAQQAVAQVGTDLERFEPPAIDVPVHFTVDPFPRMPSSPQGPPAPPSAPTPSGPASPPLDGLSTGGWMSALGVQHFALGAAAGAVRPWAPIRDALHIQSFARGGRVQPFTWTAMGSDTAPAMLTPGEYVFRPEQVMNLATNAAALTSVRLAQRSSEQSATGGADAAATASKTELHLYLDNREIAGAVWDATAEGGKTYGRASRLVKQMVKP